MADEAVTNEAKQAVEAPKAAAPAPEAPVAAKPEAPKAEVKPTPLKAEARTETKAQPVVKAKRGRPPLAAKKIVKTAPAKAPKAVRKAKPAAKPAKISARPARAAAAVINEGRTIMNKQSKIEAGLFNADQFRNVFGDVNERAKAGLEKGAKIGRASCRERVLS